MNWLNDMGIKKTITGIMMGAGIIGLGIGIVVGVVYGLTVVVKWAWTG